MNYSIPDAPAGVPFITTEEMREVDRAMIEDFGITLLQMMENAGRNLADVVLHTVLEDIAVGKKVLIAAGPGGNGGGVLAGGRHLHNRGSDVTVLLAVNDEAKVTDAVRHQLGSLRAIGVSEIKTAAADGTLEGFDVIVDGLLGYSLNGDPREPVASIIRQINSSDVPVVSNDIPSGIDSTSGQIFDPAIRATATVTIALPKTAFQVAAARRLSGDLYLGDISVPHELYKTVFGIDLPDIFPAGPLVKLQANTEPANLNY